jgi:hypothetical protein
MRQESGGHEDATSSAGAMGLMQVMPATYAQLAGRYGLGDDPYEPHDNMMAGAFYLREMYDRYGSPGFLAAYNAGPGRLNSYLSGNGALPDETVDYVASIAPRLGNEIAPSGPLSGYAAGGAAVATARGCDVNAAYDPNRQCRPAPAAPVLAAAPPVVYRAPVTVASSVLVNAPPCDPDAAYDPGRACRDVPVTAALAADAPPCDPDAAYDPRIACRKVAQPPDPQPVLQLAGAQTMAPAPMSPPVAARGAWAIQVGAFAQPTLAHDVAAAAKSSLPDLLGSARITLPPTSPFGGVPLYRARLTALSPMVASEACARLLQRKLACLVVPPEQGS